MKYTAIALTLISVAGMGAAQAEPWRNGQYRNGYTSDGYLSNCKDVRKERQILGGVLGGVAGGLLGDNVAARGVQEEGRILGALVGAVAGSQIGRKQVDCDSVHIVQNQPRYQTGYQDGAYRYPENDPYEPRYPQQTSEVYGYQGNPVDENLYGGTDDRYPEDNYSDVAQRQCESVKRITYLPDGREIHEPTLACRDMQYGPWSVDQD